MYHLLVIRHSIFINVILVYKHTYTFLKVAHLTRTRHAYQVTAMSLAKPQLDALKTMGNADEETTFEDWKDDINGTVQRLISGIKSCMSRLCPITQGKELRRLSPGIASTLGVRTCPHELRPLATSSHQRYEGPST